MESLSPRRTRAIPTVATPALAQPQETAAPPGTLHRNTVSCKFIGGQHLLIKLIFNDGINWAARMRFPSCDKTNPVIINVRPDFERTATKAAPLQWKVKLLPFNACT